MESNKSFFRCHTPTPTSTVTLKLGRGGRAREDKSPGRKAPGVQDLRGIGHVESKAEYFAQQLRQPQGEISELAFVSKSRCASLVESASMRQLLSKSKENAYLNLPKVCF